MTKDQIENQELKYLIQELASSLHNAVRYIEVAEAYKGAMTADQVEKAILERRAITSTIEIAANSCHTLASFNLEAAHDILSRSTIKKG